MAEIGWIDFSKKHRNRVNTILDILKPEGRVDELGIGVLRDGLSNRLFPGISTIQTRAKYFFIVPYILWDFLKTTPAERRKKLPTEYLEKEEYEMMWDLADHYKHEEGYGVIGISKRREFGEKIARRPSEIYWNGLNVMKCLDSKGLSANSFLNRANRENSESLVHATAEEGHGDDTDAVFENFFHLKVPYVDEWQKDLNLDLHVSEAKFLKDSMKDLENSILNLVMSNEKATEIFLNTNQFIHFAKMIVGLDIDEDLRKDIILAHDFAILMEGAHIAYNQELQTRFFQIDYFKENWNNWYENLDNKMLDLQNFEINKLFEYAPTTREKTRTFVKEWLLLVKAPQLDIYKKQKLIQEQESFAKGKKARLKYNRKDDIQEGKVIGLSLLEYRFSNAKVIIKDTLNSLENA